jgi:hypothetical protein
MVLMMAEHKAEPHEENNSRKPRDLVRKLA